MYSMYNMSWVFGLSNNGKGGCSMKSMNSCWLPENRESSSSYYLMTGQGTIKATDQITSLSCMQEMLPLDMISSSEDRETLKTGGSDSSLCLSGSSCCHYDSVR